MRSLGRPALALALGLLGANGAFAQETGDGATGGEARNDLGAGAPQPVVASPDGDVAQRSAPAEPAAVDPAPQSASAPPISHSGKGNPLWAITLDSLHATRDRPLFSASRRPPAAPVAEAEPPVEEAPPPAPEAPEQPQMTLVGVVHGDKQNIGVFVDQTGQSVLRLRVGQEERGWVVHSVDVRAATLQKDSRMVKLALPARNEEAGTSTASEVATIAPPNQTLTRQLRP